jgi:hypothetical protein
MEVTSPDARFLSAHDRVVAYECKPKNAGSAACKAALHSGAKPTRRRHSVNAAKNAIELFREMSG